jgi:hypothetical protein
MTRSESFSACYFSLFVSFGGNLFCTSSIVIHIVFHVLQDVENAREDEIGPGRSNSTSIVVE